MIGLGKSSVVIDNWINTYDFLEVNMLSLIGRGISCSIVLVNHRRCSRLVLVKICCHMTCHLRKSENFSKMPLFPQNLNQLVLSNLDQIGMTRIRTTENTWIILISSKTLWVFSSGRERSVSCWWNNLVSVVSTII